MSQPHAPSRKEPQGAALGVAFLAVAALGALAFALLSNTPQDAAEVAQRDPLSKVPLAKVPLAKVPLSKVPLSKVPLSKVPLSKVEGEASAPHGAPSLGQSSRAESAPAPEKETWTAAARDYELRYTDARGQEIVRLIRFDPSSERVAGRLQGQGQWSYPLALPAADLDEQSGVARDLRLLVDQIGQADAEGKPLQRIGLPGGGWIEAKRKLKELPPQTRAGVSCRGATTLAELRAASASRASSRPSCGSRPKAAPWSASASSRRSTSPIRESARSPSASALSPRASERSARDRSQRPSGAWLP